ncbi:glycosyltransferase [Acinetobacter baumannii]|uniref:glycosyltransferase family 2 protein n=1 Tax=Acinetobacter baumannii TaxID=470 RepID=UPI000CD019DB|nr:glycosyltransferase [Acinetobacter baumannii]AUT39146.1 glycosyl transferase [Acinetobacter baumannii]MDA4934525.1 glycosyltransferase [Acinetobacter baumannii]
MSPLVSVIIPSYNHEKFLKERIDSVLNQTFQDFELIILDDLSPDNSREIIESYRAHPKVSQIIYNEKNSGSTFFQWNKAVLSLAKGEFIWIAESDDVADPKFLEALVPMLQQNSEVVLAYSQSAKMDSEGKITGSWSEWTQDLVEGNYFNDSFQMNGQEYIEKFLIHKNTIPNASAVLFRRKTYAEIGGAVVDMKTNGDWDLWLKFLLLGDVYFHNQMLNKFRYHSTSVIAQATNNKNSKFFRKNNLVKQSIELRNSFANSFSNRGISNVNLYNINNRYKRQDSLILYFTVFCLFFIRK